MRVPTAISCCCCRCGAALLSPPEGGEGGSRAAEELVGDPAAVEGHAVSGLPDHKKTTYLPHGINTQIIKLHMYLSYLTQNILRNHSKMDVLAQNL